MVLVRATDRTIIRVRGTSSARLLRSSTDSLLLLFVLSFSLVCFLASIPSPVAAAPTTVFPTNWTDLDAVATGEAAAYDDDYGTAALLSGGSGTGNVTYNNFTLLDNGAAIFSVNASFGYNGTGFVDDEWGLFWSEDAGATWQDLVSFSSSSPADTNATFLLAPSQPWTFPAVDDNVSLKAGVRLSGGDDGFLFSLQEIFLRVVLDTTGPAITLWGPDTGLITPNATVEMA